jgi:hypothetical protein
MNNFQLSRPLDGWFQHMSELLYNEILHEHTHL